MNPNVAVEPPVPTAMPLVRKGRKVSPVDSRSFWNHPAWAFRPISSRDLSFDQEILPLFAVFASFAVKTSG
jgi:hypothetical protein